jgi:glycine/D-amino acid oxidase-like deaminating enzyme
VPKAARKKRALVNFPAALEEALWELTQRALDILPDAVDDARVVSRLAGVRPLTPDRRAIIGAVPSVAGAYIATGHGTKGIHLAALSGRIIADLVTGGGTSMPVDLATVAPERFQASAADWASIPAAVDD